MLALHKSVQTDITTIISLFNLSIPELEYDSELLCIAHIISLNRTQQIEVLNIIHPHYTTWENFSLPDTLSQCIVYAKIDNISDIRKEILMFFNDSVIFVIYLRSTLPRILLLLFLQEKPLMMVQNCRRVPWQEFPCCDEG